MASLHFVQALNGIQFGILLFLMAAGLTLVLGIMNFVNLAHGSFYMLGAYFAATVYNRTGSFALAALSGIGGAMLLGLLVERAGLFALYARDHLDQVLGTFGLILFFNEMARWIWGAAPYAMGMPEALSGTVSLFQIQYPAYRLLIIAVGLAVALAAWFLMHQTRFGMLIRAGAANREMVGILGVNIAFLNMLVFALGAALAGLAGFMIGPIISVQPGMGEPILILTLVVIIIGGIGSVRGAFLAALIIGVVDTFGRVFLPPLLLTFLERSLAQAAGPPISSMLIYLLMAAVLAFRPQGLFPVRHG